MMRVECVQCQQRQACPTPPEGPSLPDSYDVLLEKTSELRHVHQIVYIVERRKTQRKLNLQCLIASTSLKLSETNRNNFDYYVHHAQSKSWLRGNCFGFSSLKGNQKYFEECAPSFKVTP